MRYLFIAFSVILHLVMYIPLFIYHETYYPCSKNYIFVAIVLVLVISWNEGERYWDKIELEERLKRLEESQR